MRAKGMIVAALAGVLLAPTTAHAGSHDRPVPTSHGGDGICDLNPYSLYCVSQTHQVVRGEWLWKIARTTLAQELQSTATPNVRKIADMIYADNRRTIGPNKNRLRIGQKLTIRARQNWPRLNN